MTHDHNLRKRRAVEDPPKANPKRKKRVYHLKNGLVSLLRTPSEMVPITKRNAETPLLRLPAEIRNRIFEFALGGNIIDIHKRRGTPRGAFALRSGPSTNVRMLLGVLEVCRQIYHEAPTIPYSYNIFGFYNRDSFPEWCQGRKKAQLDAVRTIAPYTFQAQAWFRGTNLAKWLPGLETVMLQVEYWTPIYRDNKPVPLTETDSASQWYRVGLESIQDSMEILQKANPSLHVEVVGSYDDANKLMGWTLMDMSIVLGEIRKLQMA
ncbi:hypothetical protein K491DRAFT_709439 [Lophiostoma macrostomum CBS 122681]|uniref:Uncharacterized protein n=1 Tax=Lophiostoma macrostomum CBS 122681 TaxID=1314788 RepID=A0A6A6TRV0_9PLEO|nr:hypothetical protein K491DRAFT_709439 [Lophiostoma macrostomum CBS 122681]